MDEVETEDRDAESEPKYPESVVEFANYVRQVTNMVQQESKVDELIVRAPADVEEPFSSTSHASAPTNSIFSPISFSQHSCGSLFAKCAEHGRRPLLQTFTNRESSLFKQTFRRSLKAPERSDEISSNLRNTDRSLLNQVCPTHHCEFVQVDLTKKSLSGILRQRSSKKNKCKVKFSSSLDEAKGSGSEIEEVLSKPDERVIIRRHNSLPDRKLTLDENTMRELSNIFYEPVFDRFDNRADGPDSGDDGNETGRGRSKSLDKISFNKTVTENNFSKNKRNKNLKNSVTRCVRNLNNSRYSDGCVQLSVSLNNQKNGDFEKNKICANGIEKSRTEHFKNKQLHNKNEGCKNRHDLQETTVSCSREMEHEIDFLETEILLLRRELKKRDEENVKLQREIHKLKSVLQETSIFKQEGDLLSCLQDSHGMPGQIQQVISIPNPNKKQGISGESSDHGRNHNQIEIQRFEKDFRSKQLIKDAIMENDFLKNLDTSQVREIVETVYPKQFSTGDYVVKEGEAGSHLYVSAEGELEVIKNNKTLGRMGPGKAFGELAILYNCRRTASIKVVSDAKVWVLDRLAFQKIMMKTGLQRLQENLNFLRSVPLLQSLSNEVLAKIADALEVDFYPSGEHIIRQGASGDTFFIISSGRVRITQEKPGQREDEEIRILNKGDYFGEQALLKEDWRTANVIALSPGVECLTLDRESFIQLIGDLSELQEKDYGDQVRGFSRPSSSLSLGGKQEYDYIRLQDLDVISTLGVGGFGRVELVQYSKNKCMTFALKCLKKQHIVETKQQEHVYSERNIMMACNSPFICRLYGTFRDSKYVYMLQEALLGGEVWTILREKGCFEDYTTKFLTGCVLEAFEYLHTRGIVYRDLKPENLLLDGRGYAKLVDFGFSKRIGFSSKTWTFCGTPEYLAPEIILNKGHDRAVDYWSLGILMHELLTGIPPFTAPDPMRTYNIILKGIDMIDFPKHITRGAQSLIKRLCRDSPSERLGYQRGGIQDIKKHRWFQSFDWSGLRQRVLVPPISPLIRSPTDTSNFDYYSKETILPPDEFSNWDAEF